RTNVAQEAVVHEEEEEDLQIAALGHIKEISEEPVIEPAADDDVPVDVAGEDTIEPASEGRYGSRRRRQRRLRYGGEEQAEKEETAVKVTGDPEESVEPGAEAEEEPSSRRRRRPRRRRGSELEETESVAEAPIDEMSRQSLDEYTPFVIVHHEPLERIT